MTDEKELVDKFRILIDKFKFLNRFNSLVVNSKADIIKIPVIDRAFYNLFSIKMCPERPLFTLSTSGTSGSSSLFFFNELAVDKYIDRLNYIYSYLGFDNKSIINLIDNVFYDLTIFKNKNPYVHAGVLNKQNFNLIIEKIVKTMPDLLFAYTTQVFSLLKSVNDKNTFKQILCGGSLVTGSFKKKIKELTNAKLTLVYACTEVGLIGFDDKKYDNYYKLVENGLYIEILKENGEFSEIGKGKIIITDLYNYSTPIIRYSLGDLVDIKLIGGEKYIQVFGRCDNYIKLDGDVVPQGYVVSFILNVLSHPDFIIYINHEKESLKDKISIKIPENDFDKSGIIIQKIRELFDIDVDVVVLDCEIPLTKSGKIINVVDNRI